MYRIFYGLYGLNTHIHMLSVCNLVNSEKKTPPVSAMHDPFASFPMVLRSGSKLIYQLDPLVDIHKKECLA